MDFEKYSIERDNIKNILGYIESGQIAIPELQRPFVWLPKQITELIDSLYNGLPTGFIVVWANENIKLKDGTSSIGKKIIIDGQQRITALRAVLLGLPVITAEYNERNFKVAYNPFTEKFETYKPVHDKSPKWISNISIFFKNDGYSETLKFANNFIEKNPEMTLEELLNKIDKVRKIANREIGVVKLSSKLSISEATNIFNLMNSKGTRLGQEDYIMAKLSSDEMYDGYYLWKTIDYFCKGMHDKKYIIEIPQKDPDFANTEYYDAIKWVSKFNSNIYIPTYNDILRVSYAVAFKEGVLKKLSDLLDGRDFKEKTYTKQIAEETFKSLKEGIFLCVNEHNYRQFNLFIESTGFKYYKLINSQSSLNSAYVMYLNMRNDENFNKIEVCSYIQKWFIMSLLTGRYSSSSESMLDQDVKRIAERGFIEYFKELENSQLNNEYWDTLLIHSLESSSSLTSAYLVYLAAQIKNSANSLFSSTIKVESIIKIKGDVHHIFPKEHLIPNGITTKEKINQVCNYAYIDTNVNIDISDDAPKEYFNYVLKNSVPTNTFGYVKSKEEFYNNLEENCIPKEIINYDYKNYDTFLKKRRILMAKYIKDYYESL